MLSKTQLDKLGDRLRAGSHDEIDVRGLDEYRRLFRPAYDSVVATIGALGLQATGRPAKTTTAVVEKLIRQNIRLTQVQDIAGVRLVLRDISEQEDVVYRLHRAFEQSTMVDRRTRPSHGYRAVHLVVVVYDRPIEIQVRTRAQHMWAEISEKLADAVDQTVKYGGGPDETRATLEIYSNAVKSIEDSELELIRARREHAQLEREANVIQATDPTYSNWVGIVERHRRMIIDKEATDDRFNSRLLALLEEAYNDIVGNRK